MAKFAGNNLNGFIRDVLRLYKRNIGTFSVLLIVNLFLMLVGFFTRVKIANILGLEKFGELTYALAIGSFVNVFVLFGMDKTLVRDLIHLPDKFEQLAFGSVVTRGLVLFIVVLPIMLIWHLRYPNDISLGALLIIFSFGIMPLHLQAVFDVLGKIKLHAFFNLIQRSTYYFLIWFFIITSPKVFNLSCIGIVSLLTAILFFALQICWFYKNVNVKKIFTGSFYRMLVHLYDRNTLVFFTSMIGLVLGYANQIILKNMCGNGELGGYGVAWQLVSVANILVMQIVRIGRPKTAEITKPGVCNSNRVRFLLKYGVLMLGVGICVGIPSVLFPQYIMTLFFDQQYLFAANILRVLGFYVILISVEPVASQYIIFSGMEKLYFVSVFVGSGLSVCLCVLLIPPLAGLGAALALLIAQLCALVIMVFGICFSLRTSVD